MVLKNKFKNLKDCLDNSSIYDVYYNSQLDENLIYFESRNGRDFTGNIFRIIEEISTGNYGEFKIHVFVTPAVKSKINILKKNYNLKITKLITDEKEAIKSLEKAKYIFTDSGIQSKYIKKEGQIFVNTWHGTPLKTMGFNNVSEIITLGHIQHSLLSADYLIYPNEYMANKMINAYMIDKIYPGKILFEGYPRNSIFFDNNHRLNLKNTLNLNQKEIFVYMPTFRGILSNLENVKQKDDVEDYLSQLDLKLTENQILLVKLHAYNESKIDFNNFNHIKPFPKGYETYEIVNLADVLITDYSSVFFDFANTRRKIIIFNYDEEDYLSYRGVYFPLSDLPFPKVRTVDELADELNSEKNYDDTAFINKFCTFDNPKAVKNICRHILNRENISKETQIRNENPNILIFAGPLQDDEITDNLINMLNNADRKNYNFFITFNPWDKNIKGNYATIFTKFPQGVEFLPFRSNLYPTFDEKLDYNKYFKSNNMKITDSLKKLFKRSFDKQYENVNFEFVIDFYGLNLNSLLILENSDTNRVVWVHNNPKNTDLNMNILQEIYSNYDLVIVNSQDLVDDVSSISNRHDNIEVW